MNITLKAYAIIVAAGKGSRSGLNMPKQFFEVDGKPVLSYTIDKFRHTSIFNKIITVLPEENYDYWSAYTRNFYSDENVLFIKGGSTRTISVYNALSTLDYANENDIVCIHDGVRPFVTDEIIHDSISTAKKYGSALTAVPITDTVKYVENNTVKKTLDRNNIFAAQTPQTFKFGIIRNAYEKAISKSMEFTDDCSVAEYAGVNITVINGSKKNIKLTLPEDFERLQCE